MKRIICLFLLIYLCCSIMGALSFADEKFEVTMYVGEVIDLDSFLIENQVLSSEENMSWTSANERIVDVNSNGRVEAKEEGRATIYAKDKNNSSKVATIKIQVISMVESFELVDEEIMIKIGQVHNLEYVIKPVDGQEKVLEEEIEWNSANSKIVQVDDEGQIVGVKEGTAKVHAKTLDGGKKDYVLVTVSGIQEDILVDNGVDEVQVYVGGRHTFKATANGKDVSLGVEWTSGLEEILEIDDDGVAIGKEPGRTQVKAATQDKKKFDTIMVRVVSMVKDVELNHKAVTLNNIGDTVNLEYKLISAVPGMTPFEDEVEWGSSNSNIAHVDGNGVVTARDRGVALITATSVDGEIEAYCSISVNESADEKEIPVGKVSLQDPVEELLVGQKYKLPIVIEPADATEKDLSFRVKLGSSSQVEEEDDSYYFIPSEAGKNEITITTESEEEYKYKVEVISPIKGVSINTSELYKEKDKYYFYVGQKMLLSPVFEMRKNYSPEDILEDEVTWTIEDKDFLDIDREEIKKENESDERSYESYLIGEKQGTTILKVKSKDGEYEDEIEIKVLSSYESLELVDQVTLPINTEIVPELNVQMHKDLKYTLIPGVNYDLDHEFSIEHQYVRISNVEEEIAMAKDIIIDLQKSAIDSANSAVIYSEINEHKSRLAKLEIVLDSAQDGFCEIRESVELEDVFGEDYIVADLDDGVITGKRDGKIELKAVFPGTKNVAKGIYYFSTDLKGIVIVNESGEVVSINESGFSKVLTDEVLKKEMELAVRVEERFGNRIDDDIPSKDYVEAILNLESLDFIPSSLKNDYRKPVTRLELAEMFINLMEYISGETFKRPSASERFKDTSSETAELAYELGLIDILLPTEFRPFEEVTPVTMAKAIDRMIIAMDAYGLNQDKLVIENDLGDGQKLFVDMDKVSPSNRQYIEKYAMTYGIIEGVNNKLNPDKALTRELFLYYISKLLY